MKAAIGTLWKFLDRRGLTIKKTALASSLVPPNSTTNFESA